MITFVPQAGTSNVATSHETRAAAAKGPVTHCSDRGERLENPGQAVL
jgi:hypothetical protein